MDLFEGLAGTARKYAKLLEGFALVKIPYHRWSNSKKTL